MQFDPGVGALTRHPGKRNRIRLPEGARPFLLRALGVERLVHAREVLIVVLGGVLAGLVRAAVGQGKLDPVVGGVWNRDRLAGHRDHGTGAGLGSHALLPGGAQVGQKDLFPPRYGAWDHVGHE